ncbi:lytic transglycosylase domain-containing protein [Sinorhizobium sp. BG8]|uniref:lytic transglycosylase domain-containing protein n=1 Tax=Sinorhizobium sp. BG8 TaxID=2613773 RepID=UPI00193E14C9|nr:lytic transglycosylase domain-containing protein [Sinorhizobium sp. BG8]
MSPLIAIAGSIFPSILDAIAGGRSTKISDVVEKAVTTVTGVSDPALAEERLKADPVAASQLRIELARIALDEKKLVLDAEAVAMKTRLDAESEARKSMMTAEIETIKAELERATAEHKFELDKSLQDLRNTQGARSMLGELVEKRSSLAWVPAVLSITVTVGFFAVLGMFVVMKNKLEAPIIPDMSPEMRDMVKTLNRDQISAFTAPRSDFIIQIINICVGSLTAAFATVVSYWLGSSQGSRNKDLLAASIQERTAESQAAQARESAVLVRDTIAKDASVKDALISSVTGSAVQQPQVVEQPTSIPTPVIVQTSTVETTEVITTATPDVMVTEPVKPASSKLVNEVLPELTRPHKHFPDAVSWALTAGGISIEGARAQGTPGEPDTVRKIWTSFGELCASAAKQFGVPVELIVATIATESSGNPNARRAEPRINDESVGLMQTLVTTARSATGRSTLRGDDLLDPRTSIDAGTAYIASQRGSTHFDAVLVSAAYNAGSLKRDDGQANRWKLRCFPLGTGQHIDRFVSWFNDAMRVSDADDWSGPSECPSFAAALGGIGPSTEAMDPASPDFPLVPPSGLCSASRKSRQFSASSASSPTPYPAIRKTSAYLVTGSRRISST